MKLKLLLPAKDIPDESIVTKLTGEKRYVIRSFIKIFGGTNHTNEIKCDDNTKFILSIDIFPSINAISGETALLWEVESDELINFLQEKDSDHK